MALGDNSISGLPLSYLKSFLTPQGVAASQLPQFAQSLGGDLSLGMPNGSLAARLQAAQGMLGNRGATVAMPAASGASPLIPAAGDATGAVTGAAGFGPPTGFSTPTSPAVGGMGKIASLLSKTPFQTAAEVPAPSGLLGAGRALGPGSLGRAGLYSLGGIVASDLASQAFFGGKEQNGGWDDFVRDSLKFGGIGAGLGSIFPGVGNVVGAVGGGLVGAGAAALKDFAGWFGGPKDSAEKNMSKETTKQEAKLSTLLSQLSPEGQQQVRAQLSLVSNYATSPDQIKQGYAQVAQSLPALLQQEGLLKTQVGNILSAKKKQYANLLAAQSLVSPMLDTYLQGLGADTKQFQKVSTSFADKLESMNPVAADFLRTNSSRAVLSDDATRAAYLSQLGAQTQSLAAQNDVAADQSVAQLNAPMSIVNALQQQYG